MNSSWSQTPLRKLNVRDHVGTVSRFTGQMTHALADSHAPPDSFVLGAEDADSHARIHFDGESVTVEHTTETPEIALNRRVLTLLLFGGPYQLLKHWNRYPILAASCPLTFSIWSSERV